MTRDLVHRLPAVQLLAPQDKAHTNWSSLILDTAGFESAALELQVGAFTGEDTNNFLTVTMEESADTADAHFTTVTGLDIQAPGSFVSGNPNYQDVTGTAAQPVINAAGAASQVYMLGYHGSKRYIRLKGTYTSTGISAGLVGVSGLLSNPQSEPGVAPAAITAT